MELQTRTIAEIVLDEMRIHWDHHGCWEDPDFTETVAIEVAMNELIDKAHSLGLTVRVVEGAYADVRGVKVEG